MASLITTLRSQHAEVLEIVAQLQAELKAVELQKVNLTLGKLKVVLLAHLALEDAELYPGLIQLAEGAGDPLLARSARTFQENMKRISEGVVGFLAKYEGEPFDVVAFNRDWKSIVELLGSRIMAEETTLYPLYEAATPGLR